MKLNKIAACLAMISMILGPVAQVSADPAEMPAQVLTRTIDNGLQLSTSVSKNVYRQEAYDASYTVQVPYQEQEAYTDYETYYDTEYQCSNTYENECGYEQECRQVPGPQDCRQEQVCNGPDRGYDLRGSVGIMGCRQVQECGTNAQGRPICKTREVCDGGGGGGGGGGYNPGPVRPDPGHGNGGGGGYNPGPRPPSCHYETRCHDGGWRNQCSNEYRCRQVPRQRCGNVQVAKTRPVTRYRTVTKYRTETQCCKTEYRQVFDRQESLNVVINFPAGSELFAGERESFRVSLIAQSGAQSDVSLEVLSTISNYRVVDKNIQGGLATLTLEAIPVVIDPAQIGVNSVSGLKLMIKEDLTAVVAFSDVGQKGRLVTNYDLLVKDSAGNVEAVQQAQNNGIVDQRIVLNQRLSLDRDHTLELRVSRSGQGLAQPVTFLKTFLRPH